jgi:serine/threonine protein kinase
VLQPNQMFAGRYRIVRHIADGGMGAIFEAEHVSTEARVALKLLLPHVVQIATARRRFELEARVAARVNSEHIVRVLDAGIDDATRSPYLAMELLLGQTLAARIARVGPLPAGDVIAIMRQVARGLDAAHGYRTPDGTAQPIVHRDLKPENLFLAARGDGSTVVKILDFGIAKVLSSATEVSQEMRGTPLYMAFEQAAGEPLSPQTDIWALGLITYFALTARRYWPAANKPTGSTQALFAEILTLPLPLPSRRLREDGSLIVLPPAFDAWLLRCIDRKPSRRFGSAAQAVDALVRALEGADEWRARAARDKSPRSVVTATLERPLTSISSSAPVATVTGVFSELRTSARRATGHPLAYSILAAAVLSCGVLAAIWRWSAAEARGVPPASATGARSLDARAATPADERSAPAPSARSEGVEPGGFEGERGNGEAADARGNGEAADARGAAASAFGAPEAAANDTARASRERGPSVSVHALQPSAANGVPIAPAAGVAPTTASRSGVARAGAAAAPVHPANGAAPVRPTRGARAPEREGPPAASRSAPAPGESNRKPPGTAPGCAAFDPFTGRCAPASPPR